MELNDIYDENRNRTGRVHCRGTAWGEGEYGLVVCAWIYDGMGHLLLTRRAEGKCFAGTWENTGGAAKAGETSRCAMARELLEETGIRASEEEFEFLGTDKDEHTHYDFYCLKRSAPVSQIVLLPGETDGAQWVSLEQMHEMVDGGEVCAVIGKQFLRWEPELIKRQNTQP